MNPTKHISHDPIILASKSPRRKELLEQAGLVLEILASHIDETAAKTSLIGALSACSIHILAVLSRATARHAQIPFLANLATEYSIVNPMLVGDTVYFETTAKEKRLSESKPNTGIVTFHSTITNQRGKTILHQTGNVMVACRPKKDDTHINS